MKRERALGIRTEFYLLQDCRGSDGKRGLKTDLTEGYIKHLISDGCMYCGETSIRMSLDRIDNDLGHTFTNVVPCCIRCNYMRRNMPFEAWLKLLPALRDMVKSGIFGTWIGRARRPTGHHD